MVNRDKVILMTRLEMMKSSDKDGNLEIVSKYNKKDYVFVKSIVSFLLGSIIYWGVMVALYAGIVIIGQTSVAPSTMAFILVLALLLYIIYIFVQISISRRTAKRRYDDGSKLSKALNDGYKQLLGDDYTDLQMIKLTDLE